MGATWNLLGANKSAFELRKLRELLFGREALSILGLPSHRSMAQDLTSSPRISSTTDGVSSAVTCNEPKSRTASPSTPPRRKARRSSRPRNRWRVRFRNWSEKVTQDQLARHNRWRAAQPGVRAVSHAPKRRDCPGIGRDMHRYNPQRLL
jgi:hypothetical protein